MLAAGAPIRRHNGLVRKYRPKLTVVIRDVIGSQESTLTVERHGEAIRHVGAGVVQEDVMDTQDYAFIRQGYLGIVDLAPLLRGCDEVFGAILDPL